MAFDWFDADLFTKGFYHARTTDEQVELLNNYFQNLWRSATALGAGDDVLQKLDVDMKNWWDFRTQYFDSVFRRAADPRDLWGAGLQASYEGRLGDWRNRFLADMDLVLKSAPGAQEDLIARGLDPELQLQSFPRGTGDRSPVAQIVWGLGVAAVLVGFGIWASFKSEGYRPERPRAWAA